MRRKFTIILVALAAIIFSYSFDNTTNTERYTQTYHAQLNEFVKSLQDLHSYIQTANLSNPKDIEQVQQRIQAARFSMKGMDFWMRYMEPLAYKKVNSPLPVEWETEVFEKFEKPYKREGAGLTLASLYLEEDNPSKDSLAALVNAAIEACKTYAADSITKDLTSYHHFYLCNRLHILNLAAIYTTGFECPDTAQIIPELRSMMQTVANTYTAFNASFPQQKLSDEYLNLYNGALAFVKTQPQHYSSFDHFTFIKDYVNPLYLLNQQLINQHKVVSRSMVDYALNKNEITIFNKGLYTGQNSKGVFLRVKDEAVLAEIDRLGKLLFYDPILSGNNMRSCASCHNPTAYFTDTIGATSYQFDHTSYLPRNTPTIINAQYNHLSMLDGKHFTLQHQAKGVMTSPVEMGGNEKEIVEKVLSCEEYKTAFEKLLQYTPQEPQLSIEHIASTITYYYSKFSKYYSPFDDAINHNQPISAQAKQGFNLFMSKSQCATCHFVPQFNGVKPPYIGSEFEVLGTPADTAYKALSADKGRYDINPAKETMNAFRTGTMRNAAYTKPYMHNGVFKTLEQVIDFYDGGGGAGRGLVVDNQTLSSDSLKLTKGDKSNLIAFINTLNEKVVFEQAPARLPQSKIKALNSRKIGGEY